ncbi:transporter substrate-binding domain-containing protein [Rheinheimera riviphila]|uniref:Transporter substrate-binding domain-containing protein n=1 Tax=Rheinheimera riviphila TaxID=1834037 RepID=A0A437QID6_9GAMM|nr:transporter substrate-binding domain-containing protein [Rheinheimera riviphila]RVU34318.1 transporter substrate-binding domain-containing protein [Rheinheimera riviphila]
MTGTWDPPRCRAWSLRLFFSVAFGCAIPVAAENLRVVLEVSPPHQTYENGKVAGLSTAVVEQMLQQAKLTPHYEVYPWARAFRLAASTPNVLIYNMARTPEREQQFEWIGKVGSYKFGFLKLAARHDIQVQQLNDVQQYVVGAQRDDFSAEWLKNVARQPAPQLQLQPDVVETWRLLVKGKLDLMIDDPSAIDDMLNKHQLQPTDIKFVLFIPELEQQTWIALKKGSDPKLVQRLRDAYQQVEGSVELKKVMELGLPQVE